jgi:hypothetical protein
MDLARTPPMGWNSWNRFQCDVSEALIKEMTDAIVATGMRDAGYQYVVIDDCWQVSRDAAGTIVADPKRFPSGIKALADYVHSKGLKFGLYSDAGSKTCQGRPGSNGYEREDAQQYAEWGVDYLKYDWCSTDGVDPKVAYTTMREGDGAADRLQHVRMGSQPALDVGARRRAPLAYDGRHSSLLGLQRIVGRTRLVAHPRHAGRPREVRGTGRLERSRHAAGGQPRADHGREPGALQFLGVARGAADGRQRRAPDGA